MISMFSMLLLASDAPKPSRECLMAAQRAIDVWEDVAKGTSKEGSIAEADRKLGGRERHLEFLAPRLFENQENCTFYSTGAGDEGLRLIAIGQIPDHPEHGVRQKKTPYDPADFKAVIMQPPSEEALKELATPQTLKDLKLADMVLSNCDIPGLTMTDTVLVAGTAQAVATTMRIEGQEYQEKIVRPALLEMHKDDSCRKNARMTRDLTRKVKDAGAKIISDMRKNKPETLTP